jgi:uncharacterized membrane protein YeaQ/YmgE (transglycosylase-associated protein family)
MGLLAWAIIGLVAGAIVGAAYRSPVPGGHVFLLLLGAGGAVLGGLAGVALGGDTVGTFFAVTPWALAVAGALVLLGLHGVFTGDARARGLHEHPPTS